MVKRRAFNAIRKLQVGEQIFTKPGCIKAVLHTHFKESLTEPHGEKVFKVGDLFLNKLSPSQRSSLEQFFSMDEIEEALKSTNKTKAPGPDGINA